MTIFYKIISESEALFSLKDGEIIKSTHNTQNSYNLPRNFFKYVTENNILNKDPYIKYKRKQRIGLSGLYLWYCGVLISIVFSCKFCLPSES